MAKRCLVVLSSAELEVASSAVTGNVSAYSFVQAYGLLSRAHVQVVVATPGGKQPVFQCESVEEEQWIEQNKDVVASPADLAIVKADDFDALCIPSSIGAVMDLGTSDVLGTLVQACVAAKKPICVIGYGVLGLAKAVAGPQSRWLFEGYNVSGCSNMELARLPYFSVLPMLPEELVFELEGLFVASLPDAAFITVDRLLISGQNAGSTTLAVLNLIWLCNG